MNIIALDIGGTSIKSGLFSNDLLLESFDNPTYGNKGLEKIKESICVAINYYLGKRKIDYIAISTAGDIDPFKGEVVYASDNLKGFTGFKIKEYIESLYKVKCFVDNDAVCHLLGIIDETNQDKNIFMITLGTGVGAVLYKNKEIYYGEKFNLGKFAHYVLVENGIPCDCGQKGCAEKELSKNFFLVKSREYFNEEKSAKEIFDLFKEGDLKAKKIIDEYFVNFNNYLQYLEKLDLDLIYISGGIATYTDIFKMYLKNEKIRYVKENALLGVIGAKKLVK